MRSPRRLRTCLSEIVKPLARPPVNPSALLADGLRQRGSTQLVCGHRVSELVARHARRAVHLLGITATLNPISTRRTPAGPHLHAPSLAHALAVRILRCRFHTRHVSAPSECNGTTPAISHLAPTGYNACAVCVIPQAAVVMGPKRSRHTCRKRASNHGGGKRPPPKPSEPVDPPPNPVAKPSSSSSSSDC